LALQIACAVRAHAWLCRWTALHWASQNGHTETAMALVAAGADVHCKTDTGYGAGRCIAGPLVSVSFTDGEGGERAWLYRLLVRHTALALIVRHGRLLGRAGVPPCAGRRRTGTRRRRRRWWRQARTCTARTREGTVRGGEWGSLRVGRLPTVQAG
jgi:hypothetical protein